MNDQNRLCVITGGSSGIGLALAEQLADQGARLLLVARGPEALAQAAEQLRERGAAAVDTLSLDVADPAQLPRLAEAIAAHGEAADLVINAAGVVSAGLLTEVPREEWQRLVDINLHGLVGVLDATVPAMQARARRDGSGGQIINVASVAGLTGVPGMAAYCASKFAVVGLSQALRAELAADGIGVTTVCPGFVQTPIAGKIALFGRMDNARTRRQINAMFKRGGLTAPMVARAALKAARRNQALCLIGRDARLSYWSGRLAPRLLDRVKARMARDSAARSAEAAA